MTIQGINRPIATLILGCLPLAILTVASFAGLGTSDPNLPAIGEPAPPSRAASALLPSAEELKDDRSLCAAVADRELLSGEPLPDRETEAESHFLQSLDDDWSQWAGTTDLAREVLAVEQSLVGADLTRQESALERIGQILETLRVRELAGKAPLIEILERRRNELRDQIAEQQRRVKAEGLLADARTALSKKDYAKTILICDRLMSDYVSVVDPQTVSALRKNAQLWQKWPTLPLASPVTENPTGQQETYESFLADFGNVSGELEQERIGRVSRRLEEVRAELRRIAWNEAARQPIAALSRYDARPFEEGLPQAAEVASTYPTDSVRTQVQHRVVAWITASLPSKNVDEPEGIQEVETTSGNVLRGFFEPVLDAAGQVIGYKRYSSAEQRRAPTGNVGRYPAADLRGAPTHSLPRQCVEAYHAARDRLLADPGNRNAWSALERTCESAENALLDYRRKPGSLRDTLAFEPQRRFALAVLNSDLRKQIEVVWGK